jgi:hypothetical protein
VDLLIAATALAANLPLFTRNANDFRGIEHLVISLPSGKDCDFIKMRKSAAGSPVRPAEEQIHTALASRDVIGQAKAC